MYITLYACTDPRNQLNKVNKTTIAAYNTAVIKDNCSIFDPIIILPYSNNIFTANYMYIQEFGRYYFINNIETEHERIFIHAHVDVLETYRSEIWNLQVYLKRSANLFNQYLNDRGFVTQNNRNPDVMLFDAEGGQQDNFTPQGEYILVVAGPAELPEPEPEGGE